MRSNRSIAIPCRTDRPQVAFEDQFDFVDHRGHGLRNGDDLTSPDLQHTDQPTPPTSADQHLLVTATAGFAAAAIIAYGVATALIGITLLVWPAVPLDPGRPHRADPDRPLPQPVGDRRG
jgi:hypothetical protein